MDNPNISGNTTELIGPQLTRLQSLAIGIGVAGAVLCGIGAVTDLPGFFNAYLYAYLFWAGVTTGSLALLLLHHTVGGGWGFIIRRMLESAVRLLPLVGILFIPVILPMVLNIPALHAAPGGWAHPGATADPVIHEKSGYLNVPFFIARTVFYFVIWFLFGRAMLNWGGTQYERSDVAISSKLNKWGAFGLLIYVLTITFAGVDWVMSLTPKWLSSIYGLLTVASQGLSTLSLMLVLLAYLAARTDFIERVPIRFFRDLGNLTLAFVMLWAYMSFSQLLITYSGNTAEEATWYVARARGGWGLISLALIPFHFGLPFAVLVVGSKLKDNPVRLARLAGYVIFMRFVDLFWWVIPTFRPTLLEGLANVSVYGTPLLLGGIWLYFWAAQMRDKEIVPVYDPRFIGSFQEVVEHG